MNKHLQQLSQLEADFQKEQATNDTEYFEADDPPEQQETMPVKQSRKAIKQSSTRLSQSDVRKLVFITDFIEQFQEQFELSRQAQAITKVNHKAYELKNGSLQSKVISLLQANPKGMHICSMIDKLKADGWQPKSKYHIYTSVYSCIQRNLYAYIKVKPATFRLRQAFLMNPKDRNEDKGIGENQSVAKEQPCQAE